LSKPGELADAEQLESVETIIEHRADQGGLPPIMIGMWESLQSQLNTAPPPPANIAIISALQKWRASCRAQGTFRIAVIRRAGAFATTPTITACPKAKSTCGTLRRNFISHSLSEAAAEWAKRVHRIEHDETVDALLTRYELDVIPKKAAATRRGDMQALIYLRKVFGAMRPRDVLPRHIYRYVDTRVTKSGEEGRASALYEITTQVCSW
jgi:hypothetical protein